MMRRHGLENTFDQRASLERLVFGNGDMMCAVQLGGKAHMRTILTDKLITQNPQGFDQIITVNVAGNFHEARTSSRTKCNRMTEGISPGTPSPK